MTFKLTWLPEVLRGADLRVDERPGWQDRGHGDVGLIKGILCHHTAGSLTGNAPSLNVVTNGRPDLSGPLAQLVLGRDGTYFIVAAGVCYHAGGGEWHGVTEGNHEFIGIEAENTGLPNDPWPLVQMDAYRRGCAAILKHIGALPIMCAGHREYALPHGRKSDPDFDMDKFRADIAVIMKTTLPKPPTPEPAPASKSMRVAGVAPDTLNLRASPNGAIIGSLSENTIVKKLGDSGMWLEVKTPAGFEGWVASRYLVPVTA